MLRVSVTSMEYGQIFHVTCIGKYYCKNTKYRIYIYIYMIGLTHLHLIPGKQVIVQLSKSVTLTPKPLHLNVLIQDIENNPYLK